MAGVLLTFSAGGQLVFTGGQNRLSLAGKFAQCPTLNINP